MGFSAISEHPSFSRWPNYSSGHSVVYFAALHITQNITLYQISGRTKGFIITIYSRDGTKEKVTLSSRQVLVI